jgi:hypothetical protein
MRGEFGKIQFSSTAGTFFLGVTYERPLPIAVGEIAKEIATQARAHYSSGSRARKIVTAPGVSVELIPASNPYQKAFIPGYDIDKNSGGMIADLYLTNIQFALDDKIKKTRNIHGKYAYWVLILIDAIGYDLWTTEIKSISLELGHFNSVMVINPDGSLALEWPKDSLLPIFANS